MSKNPSTRGLKLSKNGETVLNLYESHPGHLEDARAISRTTDLKHGTKSLQSIHAWIHRAYNEAGLVCPIVSERQLAADGTVQSFCGVAA
jgi:hypothetical protein